MLTPSPREGGVLHAMDKDERGLNVQMTVPNLSLGPSAPQGHGRERGVLQGEGAVGRQVIDRVPQVQTMAQAARGAQV